MSYRFHFGTGLASSNNMVVLTADAASFYYGECTSSGYWQKIAIYVTFCENGIIVDMRH